LASGTGIGLLLLALTSPPAFSAADKADVDGTLDQILAGSHRDPKNVARDVYRHPKQGLVFFGIRQDMTVVEVWPSGGWWTEILAPLLKEHGK
jgi:predicted methyltransferase